MNIETIYIAPGYSRCRVYSLPFRMKSEVGQQPHHIDQKYWKEIAMVDHNLKLVYINPKYRQFVRDIEGQMGGTFFEVEVLDG